MRKLSTLIAIALIIVIGGVYAAWNYGEGSVATNEVTRQINMAQVSTDGQKGTISVTPDNFTFLVDDAGDYNSKLVGTGSLAITFTPSAGASQEVKDNGIKMKAIITVKFIGEGEEQYDEKTPIATNEEKKEIDLTPTGPSTAATLTGEQIVEAISYQSYKLDTKAKNDAYHAILSKYEIYIHISEVVA